MLKSTHETIVSQQTNAIERLEAHIQDLTNKKPDPMRKFTLVFKKGKKVEVEGTTVRTEEDGSLGFEVLTIDPNGQERIKHWFAEHPIEWVSEWLKK